MRKLQAWGSCSSLLVQGRARLPLPHTPCPSPWALAAMILPSGLAGTAFRVEFPTSGGHIASQSHLCHHRRGRGQQGTALAHLLVLLEILAPWQQEGERGSVYVWTHMDTFTLTEENTRLTPLNAQMKSS